MKGSPVRVRASASLNAAVPLSVDSARRRLVPERAGRSYAVEKTLEEKVEELGETTPIALEDSSATGTSGRLRRNQRGDRAELLHEAEHVSLHAMLDELAVGEAIEGQFGDGDLFACRVVCP